VEPENFERLAMVMLPHDFINFRLSGRYAMECGDASGIGLLDLQTRAFDEQLCSHVDSKLFALLPPLVDPNSPFATRLTPAAALRYSLPECTVVAPGGGDNMMAALGSGAVRDGVLVLSLGTSGCVFGFSSAPVMDPTGTVAPFCDSTGGWLPLVCTQNCAAVPEDVRRSFDMSRDTITELAARCAAGCDGVNFIPYITGERTPNWPDASGAILGLKSSRLQPGAEAGPGAFEG
jgi:xylulokinase